MDLFPQVSHRYATGALQILANPLPILSKEEQKKE